MVVDMEKRMPLLWLSVVSLFNWLGRSVHGVMYGVGCCSAVGCSDGVHTSPCPRRRGETLDWLKSWLSSATIVLNVDIEEVEVENHGLLSIIRLW